MADDLKIHTPLGFENVRAEATLAVSASFDRAAPGDPRRRPREIVIECLGPGGQRLGDPIRLLGPKPKVTYRDVGAAFAGQPVMIYGLFPVPDDAAGECSIKLTLFPEEGPSAEATRQVRVRNRESASLPIDPPRTPSGRFRPQIIVPEEGRRFFPGETIPIGGRTNLIGMTSYFYTILVDEQAGDVVDSTYLARWEHGPIVNNSVDGARFAIGLVAPDMPFGEQANCRIYTYILAMAGGGIIEGASRGVRVGLPVEDFITPFSYAFPMAGSGMAPEVMRVDINRDGAEELALLDGVDEATACRIVERRPFRSVDELAEVEGISPELLEQLRPSLRA